MRQNEREILTTNITIDVHEKSNFYSNDQCTRQPYNLCADPTTLKKSQNFKIYTNMRGELNVVWARVIEKRYTKGNVRRMGTKENVQDFDGSSYEDSLSI